MRNTHKQSVALVTLSAVALCFLLLMGQAAATPLLPFSATGDLFVLDSGSESVLRIAPDGSVSVAVTEAEILAVTSETSVSFYDKGIAFDGVVGGAMYFTEDISKSILKLSGGTVSVLTSAGAIKTLTGESSADPDGLAFSDTGWLFVADDAGSDSILKVDPISGAVSVHTSNAEFVALSGITSADIETGIAAGPGGVIYALADEDPDAIFEIASDGTPSVLASGSPFTDLDVFITRAPNGDLIVADNEDADTIYRLTTAGAVSTFLSEADLVAVTGSAIDLEGGIAFDSLGNFYVADAYTDSILKFDTSLSGSVWVSATDIQTVTGVAPVLEGGIAFEVIPEPATVICMLTGLLGLATFRKKFRR